jgi:hypothetical protein
MNDWCEEIESALAAFITVAELAKEPIRRDELKVEFLPAPHKQPSSLPPGKMAIYAFWWNTEWLKIGQVGSKSAARYTSQHYSANSSMSNLAKSLANDTQMEKVAGFNCEHPGQWIRESTCRVNILMPSNRRQELLSLLEVFLHARLRPRYER